MTTYADIERQILALPPFERARILQRAWESLVEEPEIAEQAVVDPVGLDLAQERDAAIESGAVQPIDAVEFRRRTGGAE